MTTIFTDGFESGDLSSWDSASASGSSSYEVNPSSAAHGSHGCQAHAEDGVVDIYKTLSGSYSEVWTRYNVRLDAITVGDTGRAVMGLALKSNGTWIGYVVAIEDGGTLRLGILYRWDTGGTILWTASGSFELETGRRYCIEWYIKPGTGMFSYDGIFRLYVDGLLLGEKTDAANGWVGSVIPELHARVTTGGSGGMNDLSVDDFEIATERVYPLRGYRIYHNDGVGPVDYETVRATRSEYLGEWTSDALSYPKTWHFGIRAYNQYGEEKNVDVVEELKLLSSGEEDPPRPNRPTDLCATPAADGKIEVAFSYDTTDEEAVCTHFHVCYDAGTGEVDYTTPLGSVDIYEGPATHYVFLTGALSDGQTYLFAVRAATADDVEDDGVEFVAAAADASAPEQPATLSAHVVG